MSFDTFQKCIEEVAQLAHNGTQQELNLFGIGEPTLNPNLIKMIRYARARLPFSQIIHLNTNGKTMTLELARELKDTGINHIDITAHNLEDATKAKFCFDKYGIQYNVSIDPFLNPNNWAGLVDWYDCGKRYPCPWITNSQIYIYWDGDISTCCLNAFKYSDGVHGNIKDGIKNINLKPYSLCKKCHQSIETGAWFSEVVV